jgi:hypothetical protein
MKGAYAILGIVVTVVAILNFLHAIIAFPLLPVLRQLLDTYRAIVHGAFNWVVWPFGLRIPGPLADALFLYGLAGGAFMRARIAEGIYDPVSPPAKLSSILRVLVWPQRSHGGIVAPGERSISTKGRIGVAYSIAPKWLRRIFDFLLWPRVGIQYWKRPMVHFHEYNGTHQTFAANYRPGGRKPFMHDRRVVFAAHMILILLAVVLILVVNGFLAPPSSLLPPTR